MMTTQLGSLTLNNNNNAPQTTNSLIYNTLVPTPLDNLLLSAIINLRQRVLLYANTQQMNPLRKEILAHISQALSNYQKEKNNDKLFDLYLTTNSVFNIIISTSKDNLEKEITTFLSKREELLRGDSHDYCLAMSLANEFCSQLAKTVFPDKQPNNVLFKNAMTSYKDDKGNTKERPSPWQNVLEMEDDLPASCGDFFRTADDKIQLYDGILTRAIAQLKRGEKESKDIWLNTDPLSSSNTPLTSADLAIIKQRSPTFGNLVTYTEMLTTTKQDGGLYDLFVNFKNGLKGKGHTHYVNEALDSAYLTMQAFSEWWSDLDKTEAGQKMKTSVSAIANGSLGMFINSLLNQGDFCAPGMGDQLEDILLQPDVFDQFHQIEDQAKKDCRISHEQLKKMQTDIAKELQTIPPNIHINKNIFEKLSKLAPLFFQNNLLGLEHLKLFSEGKLKEFFQTTLSQGNQQSGTSEILGSLMLDFIKAKQYDFAKVILTHRPDASQEIIDENGNHAIHLAYQNDDQELITLLCQNPRAFQVTNKLNENICQFVVNSFVNYINASKHLGQTVIYNNQLLIPSSPGSTKEFNRALTFISSYEKNFTPHQIHAINKTCYKHNIPIVLPYGVVNAQEAKTLYKGSKHPMFSRVEQPQHQHHHHEHHDEHQGKLGKAHEKLKNVFHRHHH